jgi:hypothetical protein
MSINGITKNSDASIFGSWDPNSSGGGGSDGSLTNPMTADLDMGNNQIVNVNNLLTLPIDSDLNLENNRLLDVNEISFANTGTLSVNEDHELLFNDIVLTSTNYLPYPLTSDFDCNSHGIENVSSIAFSGQSSSVFLDGALITFTHDVGFGNNNIVSIGEVSCNNIELNNSRLEWDGTNLSINDDDIIRASTINSYIDNEAEFIKLSIKDGAYEYTIGVNSNNDLSLYTGLSVNNANLVGDIVYNSPTNGITTDIINFTDAQDSQNHHLTLRNTAPYLLTIDDNIILTDNYCKTSEVVLLDNSTPHSLIVDGGLLKIDDNEIITASNIESYVENVTDLHLYTKKVADGDQDMNNHNLENVNSITWNGANADGLIIQNNVLQFSDGTHFKRCYKQVYNIPSNSSNSILNIPITFVTPSITNYCLVNITGVVMCIGTLSGSYTNCAVTSYTICAKAGSDGIFTILSETMETETSSTYTVMGSPKQDEITISNSTSDYQIDMAYDYYSDPAQTIVNNYEVSYAIV